MYILVKQRGCYETSSVSPYLELLLIFNKVSSTSWHLSHKNDNIIVQRYDKLWYNWIDIDSTQEIFDRMKLKIVIVHQNKQKPISKVSMFYCMLYIVVLKVYYVTKSWP